MEICGSSGIPILMVRRFHQSNGYMKWKLWEWTVQKCITLVGADIVLTSVGPQSTPFHGGSIPARMEICRISGLPILMVPRLHQSNSNSKRKLRAWKVQKCITLVDADTILTSAGPQSTPFHGDSIVPRMEISGISGLPTLMVPRLYQSNGNIKRKLRAWRVHKCITLVGADTVLTSAGPQTTLFHGG